MKERQRWRAEEDALLRAYVKQYGPREWHLISQRMNTPIDRDAKSCLERWKNYLKPGIKKGSLSEEEQNLVISLQAKHGNKWKKIAAEVPGRTAKRLGKWWEVYKEKQQREQKETNKVLDPIEDGKYDHILETFAEKLVKERPPQAIFMATDPPSPLPQTILAPWLSASMTASAITPASPSVTLSLAHSVLPPPPPPPSIPWLHSERGPVDKTQTTPISFLASHGENLLMSELVECCRELEELQRAWAAQKKESAWRLSRLELQLEAEKAWKRREKREEIEAKVKALREEQKDTFDRIEIEYKEQLKGIRWDAEVKEQKLAEQWLAKHSSFTKVLEQHMGCQSRLSNLNGL